MNRDNSARRLDFGFEAPGFTSLRALVMVVSLGSAGFGVGQESGGFTRPPGAAIAVSPETDSAASPAPPAATAYDEVVDLLSRGNVETRRRGMLRFWQSPPTYHRAIRRATGHVDAEVAARAEWILRQWKLGITASNFERLREYFGPDGRPDVQALLNAGRFDLLNNMLRVSVLVSRKDAPPSGLFEAATANPRRSISPWVVSTRERIAANFALWSLRALESGRTRELVELLDQTAESIPLSVARSELIARLGLQETLDSLPATSTAWPADKRSETRAVLLALDGQTDAAIEISRRIGNARLEQSLRMQERDWAGMLRRYASAIGPDTPSRRASTAEEESAEVDTTAVSAAVFAADQLGDQDTFDRAMDCLIRSAAADQKAGDVNTPEQQARNSRRWRILATHGRVDEAIKLTSPQERRSAVRMAIAADRPETAFELLGFSSDAIHVQVSRQIQALLERRRNKPDSPLVEDDRNLLSLISVLEDVGYGNFARQVVRTLCRNDAMVGSVELRDYVLTYLQLDKPRWVREFAMFPEEPQLSKRRRLILQKTLGGASPSMFEAVYNGVRGMEISPPCSNQRKLHIACELCEGTVPREFTSKLSFQQFYDALVPDLDAARSGEGRAELVFQQAALEIAALMQNQGLTDLARRAYAIASRHEPAKVRVALGVMEMQCGDTAAARQHFQSLLRTGIFTDAISDELVIQATACLYILARRSGSDVAAERCLRQLKIVCCTPDLAARRGAAWVLAKHGYDQVARQIFDRIHTVALIRGDSGELHQGSIHFAASFGEQSPGEASVRSAISFFRLIQETALYGQYYIYRPVRVNQQRILATMRQGPPTRQRRQRVRRTLARIDALKPMEINVAEDTLPKIRDWGDAEIADQTLAALMVRGRKYVDAFPRDATVCNNLAWAAAMNDQRLSEAVVFSRQAVRLNPEAAMYRDTLAEILFRMGKTEQAIQVEEACLVDDPEDWHVHEQIDRFRRAIPSAS